jgi:hypothetical protein
VLDGLAMGLKALDFIERVLVRDSIESEGRSWRTSTPPLVRRDTMPWGTMIRERKKLPRLCRFEPAGQAGHCRLQAGGRLPFLLGSWLRKDW